MWADFAVFVLACTAMVSVYAWLHTTRQRNQYRDIARRALIRSAEAQAREDSRT